MELKDYILLLLKRLWVIILFTIIVGIISYYIIYYCIEDIYQADTTLFVDTSNGNEQLTQAELMTGRYLAQDYQELVKSRTVAEAVTEQLGIKGLTVNEISGIIKVNVVRDTRFFKISVQHTDRVLATAVANTVADIFIDKTVELMNISNISVIDRATSPLNPIKPNRRVYMIIAILLGLSVSSGSIILIDYLDDTVKTPVDIENSIKIPVIGSIPLFEKKLLVISQRSNY